MTISTLTVEQLAAAADIPADLARRWHEPLTWAMDQYAIVLPQRQAMFIAQCAHESMGFTRLRESFNYSASRLAAVWPKRYALDDGKTPNEVAHQLVTLGPEAIANHVYANRMGNGDAASGDGWRFRGAGLIMLTGKANFAAASADLFPETPDRLLKYPEHVAESDLVAATVSCRFWYLAGCNDAADLGDFDRVSDLINLGRPTAKFGDAIGFDDRCRRYEISCEVLV